MASRPAFKAALDESDTLTTCLESGRKALLAITEKTFDLLVADEDLGDMSGLELVQSVIAKRPVINCAVASTLSPEDFHAESEGLGILMQLPAEPGKQEAYNLLECLNKIHSLAQIPSPQGTCV
jgi:DNA-binding NtrC family response regulator